MIMKHTLLLASSSVSRQQLLRESRIPFQTIGQSADESRCDWNQPLSDVVSSIARYKMEHATLPEGKEDQIMFVLTADTLSQDMDGKIQGKPQDREDAIKKIKSARNGSRLCTAFCLDKKIFKDGKWVTTDRIEHVVFASYIFDVPDAWIDRYLENSLGFSSSNAIAIELYGAQFLKEVRGSYTTIVGLPLFEVRQALEALGFFSS